MVTGPDDTALPPLRREVIVAAPVATAFAVFTGHIGRWWPFERFSVFGAGASVAFEDGAIVERLGTQTSEWGRVSVWEPPHRLSFSWHPGRGDEHAMTVTVTFTEQDDATLVTLVHDDWQNHPSPQDARREYAKGWAYVLDRYTERVTKGRPAPGSEPGPADAWFVLTHTAGPAIEDGANVLASPAFAEHTAFLRRLDERGLLVAAGPLDLAAGEGMTVVRCPGDGSVDVQQLATEDDAGVAGGYLSVRVRPWDVRFTGRLVSTPEPSTSPRPTAISVMLAVADAPAAVEWYRKALGATVLWDLGSVVGLEVAGAPVFLAQPEANGWATPDDVGLPTVRVEVFSDAPDAFVERALAAGGCRWHEELRDHEAPWGVHRQGGFVDPFGHRWLVGDRSPLAPHPT